MDGLLLVDKPKGWSSFDVIRKLRRVTGVKKIGHAGTLDPMATGLLILLLGNATKKAKDFLKLDKEYEAEITLGAVSTTDDAEGQLEAVSKAKPSLEEIELVLQEFTGEIRQQPPRFSAIKISGQRAYKLARKGAEVDMPARRAKIYWIELEHYKYPKLKIRTRVASGTYIRSLARDIGQALNTGAYLSALKRTKIDEFSVTSAKDPRKLTSKTVLSAIEPTN